MNQYIQILCKFEKSGHRYTYKNSFLLELLSKAGRLSEAS